MNGAVVAALTLVLAQTPSGAPGARDGGPLAELQIDLPSAHFRWFENGRFAIQHPDNWLTTVSACGAIVVFAPRGGVVATDDGRLVLVYGVIVDRRPRDGGETQHDPGAGRDETTPRRGIAEELDEAVRGIVATRRHLSAGGEPSELRRVLVGRSPVTGREERLTLVARELADGRLMYVQCVVPGEGYGSMARVFAAMLRSLRVDDGGPRP